MLRQLFTVLVFTAVATSLFAKEGMWIPTLLQKYNIEEMSKMGFKLSAEDVYSVNHASMKDAVILFGGGCTGGVISNDGLLITNHHCGFGQIQKHSSVEHDYLTNGFWAMNKSEELTNPGLTVQFLVKMEDITDKMLKNVADKIDQATRQDTLQKRADRIKKEYLNGTGYAADIKPLFNGNQYFIYIYEVFKDIRLVGAPPVAIGKFGGDTDNWIWPRHTGDFSLFRIYAGKDNKPAAYSPENVPYKPKKVFPINLKGFKEGDFTMVFGYPG
ncbi:MAG TPA: S46 family peptidase, partial [Prolixibacteraceae bacterium]|nr:S46 family peptidase [Prolixibacteraceae bacterium]